MITIRTATPQDYPVIQHVAYQTWPVTFGDILSGPQITYMLDKMYSLPSLQQQVEQKKHVFLLAEEEGACQGYVSYEINHQHSPKTKIHKIYVLPSAQGKGVGKALLQQVATTAIEQGNSDLILNVNRFNKALHFYQNIGFRITGQEDIDIGKGFLMEDFILEKSIS